MRALRTNYKGPIQWKLHPLHGFIKAGRRRFVWHVFDDEPWRDQSCPGCGKRFTEDPRFSCQSGRIHMECEFAGHKHYDDDYDDWEVGE